MSDTTVISPKSDGAVVEHIAATRELQKLHSAHRLKGKKLLEMVPTCQDLFERLRPTGSFNGY